MSGEPAAEIADAVFAPPRGGLVNHTGRLVADNVERCVRFQAALAGDLLQLWLAQMQVNVRSPDMWTWLARHGELATRYAGSLQRRQQELAQIVTESQSDFAQWCDDSAALLAGID